ncbi:MAG: endonuclease/exonuclease/phosphatase family protein [Candidatus Omnitrophica bacterium]|nr:endonuclease/exonuclease/phosphatase family protein [Candidatus Omnitrophota bacterium]
MLKRFLMLLFLLGSWAGVPILALTASSSSSPEGKSEIRVMTFNVKVDFEEDSRVPPWDDRKDLCAQVVKEARPDLLGLQETSPNQLAFFQDLLEGYETVGKTPLPSEERELFETLFPPLKEIGFDSYTDVILMIRKEVFEILDQGHWWLSPTPDKASIGFGNIFPRITVWARLKHTPSGREIVAVNTHFDNTAPSQERMAKLCQEKLQIFVDEDLPILFFGDFNTDQGRGDYPLLTSGGWKDSYLASPEASETGRDDNVPTIGGRSRIDHIFYYGKSLQAVEWKRLESPDPKRALSDHFPVLSVLAID